VGTRCADHVTPLYPQKLALTSPTGGGRSVGIVRVRTKATELLIHTRNIIYTLRDGWASPKGNLQVTKEEFAKPISKINTVCYIQTFYVRM